MQAQRQELLRLVSELRGRCEAPAATARPFDAIRALSRSIRERSPSLAVWRLAGEVEFKAADLFREPRLQEEFLLRSVLGDRINRLEATIRAGGPAFVEKRKAAVPCEFQRRWSDGLLSPA